MAIGHAVTRLSRHWLSSEPSYLRPARTRISGYLSRRREQSRSLFEYSRNVPAYGNLFLGRALRSDRYHRLSEVTQLYRFIGPH